MNAWAARLLWIATPLSVAAWIAAGTHPEAHKPVLSAALWVAALALVLAAGLEGWRPRIRSTRTLAWAAALGALALVLRVISVDRIPMILSGNEAGVGLSAMEFVRGERSNLFDVSWWSFPSLYLYLQSWSIRLFGATVFAVRLASSLIGAMTVVAVYVYARQRFGRVVGMMSAAFLAFSGFHIHFSRLGLNNIWESLLAVLLAGGLAYAIRSGQPHRFVIPGLVLGLTQYFYVGGRMFIFLVPLWILLVVRPGDRSFGVRVKRVGYALWAAAVAVLPLALFYLYRPDEFFAPWRRVSLFWYWWDVQTIRFGEPGWWVLGEQLIKAPLGFISAGLTEFYSGPVLTPLAAGFFVIGLIHVLRTLRNSDSLWLVLWLGGTTATVALSANPPAAQRYTGAAGAVAVLVGLGLADLARRLGLWEAEHPGRRGMALLAVGLMLAASLEMRHYFLPPSAAEAFGDFNTETASSVGRSLRDGRPVERAYLFVSPRMGLASHESVRFLAPQVRGEDVTDLADWRITLPEAGRYAFVFLPERETDVARIRSCFPGGELQAVEGRQHARLFLRYDIAIDQPQGCSAGEAGE